MNKKVKNIWMLVWWIFYLVASLINEPSKIALFASNLMVVNLLVDRLLKELIEE